MKVDLILFSLVFLLHQQPILSAVDATRNLKPKAPKAPKKTKGKGKKNDTGGGGGNQTRTLFLSDEDGVVDGGKRTHNHGSDTVIGQASTMQEEEERLSANPCEEVDATLSNTKENRQRCLDYLQLEYINVDCEGMVMHEVIPKIYHSVGASSTESFAQHAIASSNPTFRRNHRGDQDAMVYIQKFCGDAVAEAYSCLAPAAFRADLFRFCALWAEGGIYLDEDIVPVVPLEKLYSNCADATVGHDFPQGKSQKQMKILAGKPGAPIYKCAMDRIVTNVQLRSHTGHVLALSGPMMLHECYEEHSKNVAVTYHDTRNARWPFTGMRSGNNLLAYEIPKNYMCQEEKESRYLALHKEKKVYTQSCSLIPPNSTGYGLPPKYEVIVTSLEEALKSEGNSTNLSKTQPNHSLRVFASNNETGRILSPTINTMGAYLINLDSSTYRLNHFIQQWEYNSFTRVSAVVPDPKNPYFADNPCLPFPKGHLGTKSLMLSNVHAMERALRDGVEWAIIFEDDAELPSNLFDSINSAFERLSLYDTQIIWLDDRNREGDDVIPGCCKSAAMYHRSAMEILVNDLYWPHSELLQNYASLPKQIVNHDHCLNDWALANIVAHRKISAGSIKLVGSGSFISDVSPHVSS